MANNSESYLFESFIRRRLSSVYRSCNRFWKKKCTLLLNEIDKLKLDLAIANEKLKNFPVDIELDPSSDEINEPSIKKQKIDPYLTDSNVPSVICNQVVDPPEQPESDIISESDIDSDSTPECEHETIPDPNPSFFDPGPVPSHHVPESISDINSEPISDTESDSESESESYSISGTEPDSTPEPKNDSIVNPCPISTFIQNIDFYPISGLYKSDDFNNFRDYFKSFIDIIEKEIHRRKSAYPPQSFYYHRRNIGGLIKNQLGTVDDILFSFLLLNLSDYVKRTHPDDFIGPSF